MAQLKKLLELIEEVRHVGELSRLLFVFKQKHATRLGRVELVELANRTAGSNYRYPNPEPALNIALAVGLLQKDKQLIFLSETGRLFLRLQGDDKQSLTFEQASMLLGLFLDDFVTAGYVRSLFRHFGKGTSGFLESKSSPSIWDRETQGTARFLQQLGVLEEANSKLCLNIAFEAILPRQLLSLTILNEESLWERLEAQRLRARKAEELVLVEEKKRLLKLSRPDLAKLVIRVSLEDVSAGYDILSFEKDGSPRFIEVKSSIGKAIRFEWSVREREIASENTNRYWIYFVPLSNILERRALPILMIRNPISLVNSGNLLETPSSFEVRSSETLGSFRGAGVKESLRDWPQ